MFKLINRSLNIFILYILLIMSFAFIFYFLPYPSFGKKLSAVESIYFSVVTITTLGYGDITPKNNLGMFFTALESVVGILVIGFFLNSIWKSYSDNIAAEQSRKIEEHSKNDNKIKLSSYLSYLVLIVEEYRYVNYEVTTPIENRGKKTKYSSDFNFFDLKDIFKVSLREKYGLNKSVIEIYFNEEDNLVNDFKYLLSNFRLEDFPEMKKLIIDFFKICYKYDTRLSLIPYAEKKHDDDHLVSMIKRFKEIPPEGYHKSNTLTPVIVLFSTISLKMEIIDNLVKEFGFLD